MCNHVLEHIPDHNKAISELYRILKKGGILIAQVPIDFSKEKTFEDFNITNNKERNKILDNMIMLEYMEQIFLAFKSSGI